MRIYTVGVLEFYVYCGMPDMSGIFFFFFFGGGGGGGLGVAG